MLSSHILAWLNSQQLGKVISRVMLAIPKNVQGTGINEQDELPAIILEKQSKPDLFLDGTDVRRVLGGVGAVMARQPEGVGVGHSGQQASQWLAQKNFSV